MNALKNDVEVGETEIESETHEMTNISKYPTLKEMVRTSGQRTSGSGAGGNDVGKGVETGFEDELCFDDDADIKREEVVVEDTTKKVDETKLVDEEEEEQLVDYNSELYCSEDCDGRGCSGA